MSKNHKPQKPTGETGPVFMSVGPQGARADFKQLAFPTKKEEIEALIVRGFIRAAESILPFRVESYSANKQDDFDFDLVTTGGPKTLELAEVASLGKTGGSYKAASASYKPYDFAAEVLGLVMKKSARYGGRPPTGLYLLLYITHWAFIPSQSTIALLQFWTSRSSHGFEGIYWYAPIVGDEGIPFTIYPMPSQQFANFDPEVFRNSVVQNLDPRGLDSRRAVSHLKAFAEFPLCASIQHARL